MSRAQQMNRILKDLSSSTADIEGAAVVDNEGLMMASSLPQDADEDTVAAMGAAMLGLSERIATELNRGDFELVMVRGTDGFVIITRCGPDAVLCVMTSKGAKLGLIFLDTRRAGKELSRVLS